MRTVTVLPSMGWQQGERPGTAAAVRAVLLVVKELPQLSQALLPFACDLLKRFRARHTRRATLLPSSRPFRPTTVLYIDIAHMLVS